MRWIERSRVCAKVCKRTRTQKWIEKKGKQVTHEQRRGCSNCEAIEWEAPLGKQYSGRTQGGDVGFRTIGAGIWEEKSSGEV